LGNGGRDYKEAIYQGRDYDVSEKLAFYYDFLKIVTNVLKVENNLC